MILLDASVWIDHLHHGDPVVVRLLEGDRVLGHPWVLGEILLGRLANRQEVLGLLANLPQAAVATHAETIMLIETHELWGAWDRLRRRTTPRRNTPVVRRAAMDPRQAPRNCRSETGVRGGDRGRDMSHSASITQDRFAACSAEMASAPWQMSDTGTRVVTEAAVCVRDGYWWSTSRP
ncbi:MAG: type II toxin-antitoxin system VapC family toxin [Solirubrobacteraceae bacterium]